MGCDIHLYAEHRVGGQWESADRWQDEPDEYGVLRALAPAFYSDRNYCLFALLAGVRNHYDFEPIAEPRGLPSDVCALVRARSDSWGSDGHSHSWLTLAELLAFDWTQVRTHRGYVNGPEYLAWTQRQRWDARSGPAHYSGDVFGSQVVKISVADMAAKVEALRAAAEASAAPRAGWHQTFRSDVDERLRSHYCLAEWGAPHHLAVASFWSDTMPRLLRLADVDDTGGMYSPRMVNDVRIVFWFDN